MKCLHQLTDRAGRLGELRGERGAVAVEAALIIPVMVLMFAGIIEYGTMFRHGLAVSNASRQGARTAAVVGKTPDADFRIVQATLGSRGSLSTADIDAIVVYKATGSNGDIPADCLSALAGTSAGVTDSCNIYRQIDGFRATTSALPWDPKTRANDLYSSRDYIGVFLSTRFSSPLQMTIKNRSVADRTVFQLDPGSEQPMTIGGTLPSIPSTTNTTTGSTTTTSPATTQPKTRPTRPTTTGPPTTRPTTTTTSPATTTTTRPATTTTFGGGAL